MNLNKIIAVRTDKTVYRDGSLAIKVFNEGYAKADILNEALNTARVEETGLNIPRLEAVTKVDGKWAIVTDYVEGKTLQQMIINEMYAVYGYQFQTDLMIEYFEGKSWYNSIEKREQDMNKIYDNMSEVEHKNIDFLRTIN